MGLEELCKGTLNLQTMYGKSLGYLPDAETTCCTASVFSAECTSVCRSMVQLLKNCHRFREATFDAEKLPSHSDPDATAAICDACLYVSPTEEVPAAAALRSRLEVFPGDALRGDGAASAAVSQPVASFIGGESSSMIESARL